VWVAFVIYLLVALATVFVARRLGRVAGVSAWWFSPIFFLPFAKMYLVIPALIGVGVGVQLLKKKNEKKPLISVNRAAVSKQKSDKVGISCRFGQWFSRSVLDSARSKEAEPKPETEPNREQRAQRQGAVVNATLAAGLIVLTGIGSFVFAHYLQRRHHFEPARIGDGSILIDTESGVECSARFGMKWTDENKRAAWAAGLAAKKLEAKYSVPIPFDAYTLPPPRSGVAVADQLPPPQSVTVFDQAADLLAAEDKYNQLVEKADSEKVPDPDTSYYKSFPLCKDVR
jgi:hypothetical protein